MAVESASTMSSAEIVRAQPREHTFFSWSAQGAIDPIAIDRAEGVYLYTPEGQRILDFNSQLMSVNIGHGDRRVIDAITAQATKLQYVQPAFATEPRARLGAKLAEILPGDLDKVFFTLGGAEAIENAIKLARAYTGRHKILARYRAYHGATLGAMTLTGDPRRWANEPALVGVVRYPDTHRWGEAEPRPVAECAPGPRGRDPLRGRRTRSPPIFLETIVGTNGILIPPDGYIQGVREICDRHGILMVADEVMAGFGRTGKWFAIQHWDTVPDLMTMAKGLTSSYLPLGAVAMNHKIAEHFDDELLLRRPDLLEPRRLVRGGARQHRRLRGGRPDRERRPARAGHAPPPRGAGGEAPVRRRAPQPRPVRDPRPRPEPRPVDAAHAVQRHERRDEGDRQVLPRARPVHDDRQQLDPHEPAAVHHRGAARRGLRDHRRRPRHRRPGGDRLARWRPRPRPDAVGPPPARTDRPAGRRRRGR